MVIKHKFKWLALLFIAVFVYLGKHIYDFYSHRGAVPVLTRQWLNVPTDASVSQSLYDPRYKDAADQTLKAMQSRRALTGAASYSVAVGVNDRLVWAGAIG
ncbi:hypothetical protein [Thalassotalea sp. Y01]|uniref:hypothetical protein n=1 Tax=Thalassotalea sp. Y01 TaxID=2729613 RepID=UPI00145CDFDA|nr:hypothetical protein [Thalassotalea sp. Y01]NMP17444.1 hypothetical protein [Thalassotalea sp. Y01]